MSAETLPVRGVAEAVQGFFAETAGQVPEPDQDYFALGLVNSLFALQLVAFVEDRFRVTVEAEDLDLDNFRTIEAIAAFVGRKRAAAVAGRQVP